MEAFESKTYNIRRLLKNEVDEDDRGKNYFIPPYQRKYAWEDNEVKKLILDIFEQLDKKDEDGYNPYFIGGVVISKQSMMGKDRSLKSLEVIDGQQRLTTIVLILASIVQLLKFQGREFLGKEDAVEHLIRDITEILKIKSLNFNTMTVEEKYILERSDNLAEDYQKILNYLLEKKIPSEKELLEIVNKNDDSRHLAKITNTILDTIELYEDNELIDFTIQLLSNTWMVVTKTISIETGFFIFEKLNDSGIALEPQDLLKNYIFRTSNEEEYKKLSEKWDVFLKCVKDINITKSKILPRDFLEQYLTIIGESILLTTDKREKIFDKYKQLHKDSFKESIKLLDDLILLAKEYATIKRNIFAKYFNMINFKIGFFLVLSFYKRFPAQYNQYEKRILSIIIRLGLTYLIIGQSKNLSNIVPKLCHDVISEDGSIEEILDSLNESVNRYLYKKQEIFDEIISSTNVFRKKPLTKLLLIMIEYHLSSRRIEDVEILSLMPKTYYPACEYKEINEDNCSKYANFIGNLFLFEKPNSCSMDKENLYCFQDRYLACIKKNSLLINDIDKTIVIKDGISKIVTNKTPVKEWGKISIIRRSQELAEISKYLIIKGNLKTDFFN